MKVWKTERIVYFKPNIPKKNEDKSKSNFIKEPKHNLHPKSLLNKKFFLFKVEKFEDYYICDDKDANVGRWTLKEHIQFLQALEKYGVNWKIIRKIIRTRTATQIRSHCQKFFIKLKNCKDEELGIDFTLDHIRSMKDVINHIKSVNKNFDVVNVLLYISGKYSSFNDSKKMNKIEKAVDINNIFNHDIKENNNNNNEINNKINFQKFFDINDNNKLMEEITKNQILIYNRFNNNNSFGQNINCENFNLYSTIFNYINNAMIMNFVNNLNNINNNIILGNNIQNLNNFYTYDDDQKKSSINKNLKENFIINNNNGNDSQNINDIKNLAVDSII